MQPYAHRQAQVFSRMSPHSIAIIPGNNELNRNGDACFPFRQNSDFYYVTGFNEPQALAVLLKTAKGNQYILFNRPNNPAQEQWEGKRAGQLGAVEIYGANHSFSIDTVMTKLSELLQCYEHSHPMLANNLLAKHVHKKSSTSMVDNLYY